MFGGQGWRGCGCVIAAAVVALGAACTSDTPTSDASEPGRVPAPASAEFPTPPESPDPVEIRADKVAFVQIAVGSGFGCGLSREGSVECWGDLASWRADTLPNSVFVPLSFEDDKVSDARVTDELLKENLAQIAAGDRHACALTAAG